MSGFIYRWLVIFLAVLIVSYVLPFIHGDVRSIALFALVIGLLNAFLLPVLRILTLPLSIITLGLFSLVLNLFVFWLADRIVPGIVVEGAFGLVVSAIAISLVGGVVRRVLPAR